MTLQCVILAGGRGSRINEESYLRPKPMIEIGGRPILWHIMKGYAEKGITRFVICLGYRGYMIKEYFMNYFLHSSDVTIDMRSNVVSFHDSRSEPWEVTLVDTGETTLTGGRILRARSFINADQPFCLTYGDGLADIDFAAQVEFHCQHDRFATMTVVRPPARFGRAIVEADRVIAFEEKPQSATGVINGGFFVLSPRVLDFIDGDDTPWETTPLQRLVARDQLRAWHHDGFWQPMDTLREKELLESMWGAGKPPWKTWA